MTSLFEPQPGRVLIAGHRGAEALAPENTWASFKAALAADADLIELDVQLTRDGTAIVFHDFSLQPKLGDPRWVRDVEWNELRHLDLGSWFHPDFSEERIPRFDEVLVWAQGRIPLWIDLKHGFVAPDDDRLEMAVLDLIETAGMADRVVISSWDQVALSRIHVHYPEIPLVVNLPQRIEDPVGYATQTGARWVVLFWPQADRQAVARLQKAGIVVVLTNIFTGDYSEAQRLGVNVITARDPGTARAALAPIQATET